MTTILTGHRVFYEVPEELKGFSKDTGEKSAKDPHQLSAYIRENIIGNDVIFKSPFGLKRSVYCDWMASGRSLSFIEDFILTTVLPTYGNTHSTSSFTSSQTTFFRHEARDIFRNAVRASESDAVLFVGSGTTGAIHKLIQALDFKSQKETQLTVFFGLSEHHSNVLPWKTVASNIVWIKEKECGCLDIEHLEEELKTRTNLLDCNSKHIGCFTAASNITGQYNDDIKITALLHRYGALSFWDYASAAPYVHIDMNPKVPGDVGGLCSKDALYFSTHKFIGGVQTPGILIAKKSLFRNPIPGFGGGGGSVFFVTKKDTSYLQDTESREESGTPAIVECIRAGLVMQLKLSVGVPHILASEEFLLNRLRDSLLSESNLVLLGNWSSSSKRLPILSFLISTHGNLFLHHNFVTTLLNDLFGIQSRSGCACAGPYAQHLLGVSHDVAKIYEGYLCEDSRLNRENLRRGQYEGSPYEILRPGFTRLNIPWFASEPEIDFIVASILFIARHGWKLLPQYTFNNETGEWKHHSMLVFKDRTWLHNISYSQGYFCNNNSVSNKYKDCKVENNSEEILRTASNKAAKMNVPDQRGIFNEETKNLRWFLLPIEAQEILLHKDSSLTFPEFPFFPKARHFPCSKSDCGTGSLKDLSSFSITLPSSNKWSSSFWWSSSSNNDFKSQNLRGKEPQVCFLKSLSRKIINEKNENTKQNDVVTHFSRQKEEMEEKIESLSISKNYKSSLISFGWKLPGKNIFRPFLKALSDFSMIRSGDRILICISGGKDSLSLLHCIRQYQFVARKNNIHFEFAGLTVDPGSSAYDPKPLIPYLASLNVPYFYEEQNIIEMAARANVSSICSFCSRLKRGRMYSVARKENFNVLALGQHLDDAAESFLMSICHNGRLRTMKANYFVQEKDLRVIRPLIYVREKNLRGFAESENLPVIPENCPACFESPKERQRVKQILAMQECLYPKLYESLKAGLYPLMKINVTGLEKTLFGNEVTNNE